MYLKTKWNSSFIKKCKLCAISMKSCSKVPYERCGFIIMMRWRIAKFNFFSCRNIKNLKHEQFIWKISHFLFKFLSIFFFHGSHRQKWWCILCLYVSRVELAFYVHSSHMKKSWNNLQIFLFIFFLFILLTTFAFVSLWIGIFFSIKTFTFVYITMNLIQLFLRFFLSYEEFSSSSLAIKFLISRWCF